MTPLDVVHRGHGRGSAPAVVATAAWNGMGFGPHRIWAWRRAEMNALAETPFLCTNGARATMAHIRTLPLRAVGGERLRAIALRLLEDLAGRLDALPPGTKVGLVLGLPERFADSAPRRQRAGRGELESEVEAWLKGRSLEVTRVSVPRGHASFAFGVLEAITALEAQQVEAVIVGGVDTYYDPDVVEALLESKRLFDGENLDAFIPGEGGAFCLLTRPETARRYRWPALAHIESAATNGEPAHMGTDLPCMGLGLSRPMRAVADRLQEEKRQIEYWLADLTNENYRTQEWLLAFPRASAGAGALDAVQQFLPAFLGDLGAATMATGAVLAIEAFLRGDPPVGNCLVTGSSFGEHRGVVLLSAVSSGEPKDVGVRRVAAHGPKFEAAAPRADAPPRPATQEAPAVAPAPPAQTSTRLGLIAYASACAESRVFPENAAAAWAKFGLTGAAVAAEHAAWQDHFSRYPEERREFEQQLESFSAHWRSQRR